MSDQVTGRVGGKLSMAVMALFLAALVLAVYLPVGGFQFVNFDDDLYVSRNNMVSEGLTSRGIVRAFTSFHAGFWIPLTWLSFMLDAEMFGLRPGGFHLVNALLHAVNAILLFMILRAYTAAFWRSAVAAALFAVHPLHVESVAWVTERKDVLSTCFMLLALGGYLRYLRRPGVGRYATVAVLMAMALMAKPMVVTFPLLLLVLDGWPLGRWRHAISRTCGHPWPLGRWRHAISRTCGHPWPLGRAGWPVKTGDGRQGAPVKAGAPMQRLLAWRPGIEKAPLLAMAMVFGLVAIASQKEMAMVPLSKISLGSRVVNALVVSGGYLAKALWPAGLSAIYLPPSGGYPAGRVVLSAVFLAGLVLMAAAAARRRPYLTTGLLWFLVALVPVNGMLQAGFQSMADRFAYVPLMGIYLLVVWGAWDLAPAWRFRGAAAAAVSGLVITVLLLAARHQVGFWHDSASLFGRALSVTPDNWVARNNLAAAYLEQGNNRGAIANYQEVIKVKPNLPKARFNLGRALLAAGEPGQAEIQFRETIRLIPDLPEAHLHLGIVLAIQGKLDEAITALEEALRLKPDSVDVHYNLALALQSRGRPDEAAAHYREALRLRPDHPLARRQLEGIQGRGRPGT